MFVKADIGSRMLVIYCAHCGHKIEKSFARLLDEKQVTCPRCGRRMDFNNERLRNIRKMLQGA